MNTAIKKIAVPVMIIAVLLFTALISPVSVYADTSDILEGTDSTNIVGEGDGEETEKITLDELNGKELGVQTAVLYEELLLDRLPDAHWNYYTMPNDMIFALQTNKIAAYLIEEVGFYAQYAKHPELVCLDEYAGVCPFSIVIGANERQDLLLGQMNEYIKESKENGFLDDLYDYWVMHFDADTSVIRTNPVTTGENGTVTIAIEGGYEPFSFESNGEFSGFDVEFMKNFCAKYGYEWDFQSVPFESIAPGAETGKYDFGMNIAFSEERSGGAVLTDTYYDCNIVMVVEGDNEASMTPIQKLKNSFYKTFIKENRWELFLQGTGVSLIITVSSVILGTLLGFLAYLACRHGNKIANRITDFVTWIIDGMPTVVLLMILFYIVFGSSKLPGAVISIVGFSLIFACAMYDMLCVGCNAIPKGQTEASRALGYSDKQCFFKIILPQAARHFLPIYKNEVVDLIKETSVVGYIAVLDLTKISDLVRSRTYEAFFALIATAIVYFLIEALMNAIIGKIETCIDPKRRSKEKVLSGIVEEE